MTKQEIQTQEFGLEIKQRRSQVTYDSLIEAGFKLLEQKELEAISVAELAKSAGYSVGAFYARFRSKDEFFDALISKHLEIRTHAQQFLFANVSHHKLISQLMENVVNYYSEHHKFWRAVLVRSVRDPAFLDPIRRHRHESTQRFIQRLENEIKRSLAKRERDNISFAFQMILDTLNSTIMIEAGPVFIGEKQFVTELVRAFSLISEYEQITASTGTGKSKTHK